MHRVFGKEGAGPLNHTITPLGCVFNLFNLTLKMKRQCNNWVYVMRLDTPSKGHYCIYFKIK